MPSSLAELPGSVTLRGLCQRYDQAYEALVRDDLDRVALLLQETEAMLATLTAPIEGNAAVLQRQASDSQGRLMAALDGSMTAVQEELGRVRLGRRVLQGYGARRQDSLGARHESRS